MNTIPIAAVPKMFGFVQPVPVQQKLRKKKSTQIKTNQYFLNLAENITITEISPQNQGCTTNNYGKGTVSTIKAGQIYRFETSKPIKYGTTAFSKNEELNTIINRIAVSKESVLKCATEIYSKLLSYNEATLHRALDSLAQIITQQGCDYQDIHSPKLCAFATMLALIFRNHDERFILFFQSIIKFFPDLGEGSSPPESEGDVANKANFENFKRPASALAIYLDMFSQDYQRLFGIAVPWFEYLMKSPKSDLLGFYCEVFLKMCMPTVILLDPERATKIIENIQTVLIPFFERRQLKSNLSRIRGELDRISRNQVKIHLCPEID